LQHLHDRHVVTAVNILFPQMVEGFGYPIGHKMVCYVLMKLLITRAKNLFEIALPSYHWAVLPPENASEFFNALSDQRQNIRKVRFHLVHFDNHNYFKNRKLYIEAIAAVIPCLQH